MAKNCRVVRNNEGQIQSVKDKQGKDSSLFNSLNNIIKEPNISLEYYAITESDDFLESMSKKPRTRDLFEFNNSSVKTPLNSQEVVDLQNSILSTSVVSSTDLYEKLYNVLVNKNGIITFNEDKLKTIYNDFEVARILSSPELQQTIKESFLKLKNTPEVILEYNDSFVIPISTSLNVFGKQVSSNPYVLEKEINETVAGVDEKNITEELGSNIADRYISNPEFKAIINEKATTLRNTPLLTTIDGILTQKEDNIKNYLQDVVISEKNTSLTEDIDILNRISSNRWSQNRADIQDIIENIVERSKDNGIDLRDFSIRTQSMAREEILSFLSLMEDLLENPSMENVNAFSDVYNSILNAVSPLQTTIISKNEFDTSIDTTLSEYEMLRDFSMVKKSEGIYRKVIEQSLDELYTNYFQNNKQGFKSVEDFITFVQQEGIQKLNVSGFEADTDILEKMYLYKKHFDFPLDTTTRPIKTENLDQVTIDEDFLTNQFVKDFNRFVLQTDNLYFTVNEKGINIVSNDPITTNEALLSLPAELIEPLAQYNVISKTLNIDLQPESTSINLDSKLTKRQDAVNNPESVSKLTGEYTYLEDGVMAVKNEDRDFVRTPTGVYEMVYEKNNIKFYGQLPQANPNYKLANIQAPLSNIDYTNYNYLENSPELFKEAKNYYTKKELEEINQQNFNC